ncbi:MAG: MFS transporter [Acidimicrobiales bacterium]
MRDQHPCDEDIQDSLVDGDRPFTPGARAALRHRVFRIVFTGAFLSNVGTWMQNAVLAGYAYTLTHSKTFVGLLTAAQLAPLLLLSLFGGYIADLVDRRRLIIWVSIEQLAFSIVLALIVRSPDPSRLAIFLAVLAIGIGQAVYAPAYSAVLPALVGSEDLAGAISLNSAQMNGSRVIGPPVGGILLHLFGPSWVFAGNAVTYLFVIGSLMMVRFPAQAVLKAGTRGLRQLLVGVRVARRDKVVGRSLITIFLFSGFALAFIGQLASVVEDNLGIKASSAGYGLIYGTFGVGAMIGALSIGTVFVSWSKPLLVRIGMAGYAVTLTVFALLRSAPLAYPVILVLGFFYFGMVTSLSTVLQERLDDSVRGRVMALWVMGFGGTVGFANIFLGRLMDATSVTAVLLANAAVAAGLFLYADLRVPDDAGDLVVMAALAD